MLVEWIHSTCAILNHKPLWTVTWAHVVQMRSRNETFTLTTPSCVLAVYRWLLSSCLDPSITKQCAPFWNLSIEELREKYNDGNYTRRESYLSCNAYGRTRRLIACVGGFGNKQKPLSVGDWYQKYFIDWWFFFKNKLLGCQLVPEHY